MAVHVGVRGPGHLSRTFGTTPSQFLGAALKMELDAERGDLLTLAGSVVTTWTDTVASKAFTQATAGLKPAYSATAFNTTRPGITPDGTDDTLVLSSQPLTIPCEIWLLVDQTALAADTTTRTMFSFGGATSTTRTDINRIVTTGVNRCRASVGNGASQTAITNGNVDFSGRCLVRVVIDGVNASVEVNQVAGASTGVVPSLGTSACRVFTNLSAGGPASGIYNYVAVTSLLSAGDAALMYNYLNPRKA